MSTGEVEKITPVANKKPFLTITKKRAIIGYIFISPFILGFVSLFIGPSIFAGWLSFHEWNLIETPSFVGFQNFADLFSDEILVQSLKVTVVYTLLQVPLGLIFGFLLALLMNTKVGGIRIFRTIYYLPSIVPAVANAVLWAWIFNPEFGLLNAVLRFLGFPRINWLLDVRFALPSIILMSLWGVGGGMIIYLAGLQGIPEVYYEAAEIDGAGWWSKFRHVTIPLMSPILFFNLIMGIIGSFQVFTAGYLLTSGGPKNSTLFYVLYLYRVGFQYFRMGYAAVLGWLLFFIILVLTLLVFKYIGRNVYYEEAK